MIRFGLIGTNFITKQFLEAASLCKDFEVGAVYSRAIDTGNTFIKSNCGDYAAVALYTDLTALAADPAIDAVYIASPTAFHKDQALCMLRAGKHVLCEKPAASNHAEWQEMQAAANDAHVVLLEAMRPLHIPAFRLIKESLSKLGVLRCASFNYCQYSSRYDKFKAGIIENAFRPELSNGALMDIGIYCIEMMLGLFGMPLDLYSHAHILPNSIDGCGSAIAVYDSMHSTLTYSKISPSDFGCEIQGEKGTLSFQGMSIPKNGKIKYLSGEEKVLFREPEPLDMHFELEAFIAMVQQKRSPAVYQEITRNALQLADKIRKQNNILFPADKCN